MPERGNEGGAENTSLVPMLQRWNPRHYHAGAW
jgi:hypothetical protein